LFREKPVKTLLAFFGMIFFALLLIAGLVLVFYYYDLTGEPAILGDVLKTQIQLPKIDLPAPDDIRVTVVSKGEIVKTNPLEDQPLPIVATLVPAEPEPTLAPQPTATEIPPLDPVVYQTEAMIRLKRFAAALESFLATNDRVSKDTALLQDDGWRAEMKGDLAEVAGAGRSLANIGRPPAEYADIDAWLVRIGSEAEQLQANYLRALKTGSAEDFSAAGDNFVRIREYLTQAATRMIASGWKTDP
jgi:hypothetical protein